MAPLILRRAAELAPQEKLGLVDRIATKQKRPQEGDSADLIRDLRSVVEDYLRLHARPRFASAAYSERLLELHVMPSWRDRPVSEIRRRDVVALLDEIAVPRRVGKRTLGGSGAARDVKKKLSAVFDWALRRDLVELNPCARVEVSGAPPQKKDRVLTDDEVAKL